MAYRIKICPKCGTENLEIDKKCYKCKTSLKTVHLELAKNVQNAVPSNHGSLYRFFENLGISFLWAIAFMMISITILTRYDNPASDPNGTIGLQIFLGIFGALAIIYLIRVFIKKNHRLSGVLVLFYWFLGLSLAAISPSSTLSNQAPTSAEKPEITYPIPVEVQPIISRLSIDTNTINKVQIIVPENNSKCLGGALIEPGACFKGGQIIYPKTILNNTQIYQNALFAHEYLHYIWQKMPQDEKNKLIPLINQAYQNGKPYLDQRISKYDFSKEGPDGRINELHSYVGTEIADNLIPNTLLDHYKKHLPNRDALPSYYPYPVAPPPVYFPTYTPIYTPPVYTPTEHCFTYQSSHYNSFTQQIEFTPEQHCSFY